MYSTRHFGISIFRTISASADGFRQGPPLLRSLVWALFESFLSGGTSEYSCSGPLTPVL